MSCEYCHTIPHLPGCPNSKKEKTKIIGYCDHCGKPIYEWQYRYEIVGVMFHERCLKNLPGDEILELFGIEPEIA